VIIYYRKSIDWDLCLVARMVYWSVGGSSDAAQYIHRTTLDVATAADNVQRFVDVTDNSVMSAAAAAVQDIVIDVTTRRFAFLMYVRIIPLRLPPVFTSWTNSYGPVK